MAILTFAGNQIGAQFSLDEDQGNNAKWDIGQTPFQATDIVRIEISDADIGPDGEFDPTDVSFESFTVERDGVVHTFAVNTNSKVKESGGGSNIEQGESYFVTNDAVTPPASGPFASLSTQNYLFSSETTFDGGPDDYSLRRFGSVDLNGDGDFTDPGETGDGTFNATPVCYCPGTMILTDRGERAVEDLGIGDRILTADRGLQPIVWFGRSVHRFSPGPHKHKPIEIKAGALGAGVPRRTLVVSPQHHILFSGAMVEELFGTAEVLALAKALVGLADIRAMNGKREVVYYCLMCVRHEVILAEGAWSESFYPGRTALEMIGPRLRGQVETLFPAVKANPKDGYGPKVRRTLSRRETEELVERLRERRFNGHVERLDRRRREIEAHRSDKSVAGSRKNATRPLLRLATNSRTSIKPY